MNLIRNNQTQIADVQIPDHRTTIFLPKKSDILLVVFVLNEGERFRRQLEEMQNFVASVDFAICDGGSVDGSIDEKWLAQKGVRALMIKTAHGGLSSQARIAMNFAAEEGYLGIITMDGNNKDSPKPIAEFAEALKNGYDHIQGSRFISGGRHRNTPSSRKWAIRALHAPLISAAAGFKYTDTTNGFRAYSLKFLLDPRVQPFRNIFVQYELHHYLSIRAGQLKFKIIELPTERNYPDSGKIPTKLSPIRGSLKILKTLLAACLGAYDP